MNARGGKYFLSAPLFAAILVVCWSTGEGKYDCNPDVYSTRHGLICTSDEQAIELSLELSRCRKPEEWLPEWECKARTLTGIRECMVENPTPMTYVAFAQLYFEVVRFCGLEIEDISDTVSALKAMAHNALLGGHETQEMAVDQIDEMAAYTTGFLSRGTTTSTGKSRSGKGGTSALERAFLRVLADTLESTTRLIDYLFKYIPRTVKAEEWRRHWKMFVRSRAERRNVYHEIGMFNLYLITAWVLIYLLAKRTRPIIYFKALVFNIVAFIVTTVVPNPVLRHAVRVAIVGQCDIPDFGGREHGD